MWSPSSFHGKHFSQSISWGLNSGRGVLFKSYGWLEKKAIYSRQGTRKRHHIEVWARWMPNSVHLIRRETLSSNICWYVLYFPLHWCTLQQSVETTENTIKHKHIFWQNSGAVDQSPNSIRMLLFALFSLFTIAASENEVIGRWGSKKIVSVILGSLKLFGLCRSFKALVFLKCFVTSILCNNHWRWP